MRNGGRVRVVWGSRRVTMAYLTSGLWATVVHQLDDRSLRQLHLFRGQNVCISPNARKRTLPTGAEIQSSCKIDWFNQANYTSNGLHLALTMSFNIGACVLRTSRF